MDLIEPTPPPPSYWCYQCTRLVPAAASAAVCPHCHGGFVQLVDPSDFSPPPPRFPPRRRRTTSPFNPLILLRSPPAAGYDLYYDDGAGSGLRPLPPTMSHSLLGSGFEPMLHRISQIGFSVWAQPDNPPASKRAVAALPTLEIQPRHVDADACCAVCMDPFALGAEALQMPCDHVYHSACILPWLDLHSSCPVCRRELPGDDGGAASVGLSIWRLPGGGLAVGRFVGGGGDVEMPPVYSEMDGGAPREIEFGPWIRPRRGGRLRRFFGNLGSVFRRRMNRTDEPEEDTVHPVRRSRSVSSHMGSVFSWRRNRDGDSVAVER